MVVFAIAFKYLKSLLQNLVLIPMLVGLPLFQIYIMQKVTGGIPGEADQAAYKGFVELITLSNQKEVPFANFTAATTLVQFLLIAGVVAASMFITEKEHNTLMRIFAAPVSKSRIILGNILGQLIFTFIIAAAIIGLSAVFLGVEWGSSWPGVFIITLLIIYTSVSMGFAFSAFFKTMKLASGVMSFIVIVMTFLSGGFTMDNSYGVVSSFTINKWAYGAYVKLMEGQGLYDTGLNLLILFVLGSLLNLIAMAAYRREGIYE